jgi:Family of unknown function (DUF6499)
MAIAVTVSNAKRDGTDMGLKKKLSKKPEWLPDWKDESKYPDPKEAGNRVWAWEFLRRNSKYQKVWDQFASQPSGLIHKDSAEGIRERLEIGERLEKDFGVLIPAPPSLNTSSSDFASKPRRSRHLHRIFLEYSLQGEDKLAVVGGGPVYRLAHHRYPRYAVDDLDDWARSRLGPKQRSTSEVVRLAQPPK